MKRFLISCSYSLHILPHLVNSFANIHSMTNLLIDLIELIESINTNSLPKLLIEPNNK